MVMMVVAEQEVSVLNRADGGVPANCDTATRSWSEPHCSMNPIQRNILPFVLNK